MATTSMMVNNAGVWTSTPTPGFSYDGSGNLVVLEGIETTEPAAPSANGWKLFAVDNGAGKTKLMVRFPSGASQQLAIEP